MRGTLADGDVGRGSDEAGSLGAGAPLQSAARYHVAFALPGLGPGGAERVVSILANVLVKRGWWVTVIAFTERGSGSYYRYDPAVEIVDLGFPPERLPGLRGTVRMLARAHVMRRAVRTLQPDAIVSFLTRTNVIALLATIGMNVPVVVSERNNPESQTFGRAWNFLRSRLYPRAFGLVTITSDAMACFPKRLRRREWIIPNPVEPVTARTHAQSSERKAVVGVGRLVPQKGFDMLLRAFGRIAATHPEWDLVIWGAGPEREALENSIGRLGLSDRVRLPGVTLEPGSWVSEADMFVLSSRYEGWGNVLLEALAAGIPSVSFDCPWGPREMLWNGANGLLVPPGNVSELAKAMARMMSDAELRERLANEGRRTAERYSPEAIVLDWENVLRDAIGPTLNKN